MTNNWRIWLHGLAAAFVSGGAGAGTTAISGPIFAPNELSFSSHPLKLLGMMSTAFLVSGFGGACAYLKQSPVPLESQTTTVTSTVEVSSATTGK